MTGSALFWAGMILARGWEKEFPAHGDSGGPTFLNGAVAGIHSFSFRVSSSDVDDTLNQSFGEFSADVRLSEYADWIDAEVTVPEPPSLTLVLPTLFTLAVLLLRRRYAAAELVCKPVSRDPQHAR